MGATFSRIKNWTTEVLSNTDLNAEIDNILNNLSPSGVDDYSTSTAQMKLQTSPGDLGSESLATSLAGEIERLRYVIAQMKGDDVTYWYEGISTSLTDLINSVGSSSIRNRVVSGKSSTASSAARYLVPAGASNLLTLDCTTPSFTYIINGNQYTLTADVNVTALGTAPTTNNTCLINDTAYTSQELSKWAGEDGRPLTIDNAGSEITSLVGKFAGFKVVSGGNTEYFVAYVKSATQLTSALRGYFFNSSGVAVPRIAVADNNTITLNRLTWAYINTTGSIALGYTNPSFSYTQPTAPATGDYWYDIANEVWKSYDSVTWQTANATLIGVSLQDTANCVAARAFDFSSQSDTYNNLNLEYVSATQIRHGEFGGKISVGTERVDLGPTIPVWDITANLETGYTETVSTIYFAYVGETGKLTLSPEKPYSNGGTNKGLYHPYEIWRHVGSVENNAASDFNAGSVLSGSFYEKDSPYELENISFITSVSGNALTITLTGKDGAALSGANPGVVTFRTTTAGSAAYKTRRLTQPITVTVSSGSTLGSTSAVDSLLTVYLVDTGSDVVLGVSNGIKDEMVVQSTTAEGGAGAADSKNVIYTTASQSNKPIRIVGQFRILEATAGTWATNAAEATTLPTATSNPAVAWSGYHAADCTWARAQTTYGQPGADSSGTFATRWSVNFPSVSSWLDPTNLLPGIVFTPVRPGHYYVKATASVAGNSAGHQSSIALYNSNSTAILSEATMHASGNGYAVPCPLDTVAYLSDTGAVTYYIYMRNNSATCSITTGGYTDAIDWTVIRIGD